MTTINDNTVGGLLAYCEWLIDKGYGTPAQVEPWKTAIKKVFFTVEGEDYESLSFDDMDVDDYVSRFRVLAGSQYKHESITAYGSRLKNALEAHAYFRENGRPPAFRQVTKRNGAQDSAEQSPTPKAKRAVKARSTSASPPEADTSAGSGFFDLVYPLDSGQMAHLRLPKRMSKADVDRISTVLRTLQGDDQQQRQLPPGEESEPLAA